MPPAAPFASLALFVLALLPGRASAGFVDSFLVDYEAGPLYIAQNDNAYGPNGTKFTAAEVGQQENLLLSQRIALALPIALRHELVLTYAPLDVATEARLDRAINLNDVVFPEGTVVKSRYLFDGYRLTYLFALVRREQFVLQIGLAGQIRNAQVALTGLEGTLYADESDIGVVGAPVVRLFWDPFDKGGPYWFLDLLAFSTFGLFGDVSGGIYDVAATWAVPVVDGADVIFRARLLGGGATVPDRNIENWGNFVSVATGLRVALPTVFR